MAICDDRNKFTYFSCQYPGTTHDSVAYQLSRLRIELERTFDFDAPRYLIGDKGYTNQKTMIVPFKKNQLKTKAQKDFNILLGKVRVLIEHTFGYELHSPFEKLIFHIMFLLHIIQAVMQFIPKFEIAIGCGRNYFPSLCTASENIGASTPKQL